MKGILLSILQAFRAWWDKPAHFWQFWLPKSGPCFWFGCGIIVASLVAAVL